MFVTTAVLPNVLRTSAPRTSVPLMSSQELDNLPAVKEHIKNLQFEEIVFDTFLDAHKEETLQRRGIIVRRPNALGTVLICHGYLGCKRDAIALKHLFPSYNVMSFDFRAHGDNREGQVSTIGRDEAFDVMGAVDVIKSDPEMRDKPVIAFGYSMGAVSAIEAQAQKENLFDAMILDCPYDSTDDAMGRGLHEKMKINLFGHEVVIPGQQFLIDHMYDQTAQMITNFLFQKITKLDSKKVPIRFVKVSPVDSIKKITVPCFFIHCENDKKVPVLAVERLYENKPGFKRLWITQGKSHFGSYQHNPEMYWYKVNKFLSKLNLQDLDMRQQERVCDQRTMKKVDKHNENHVNVFARVRKNQPLLQKKVQELDIDNVSMKF